MLPAILNLKMRGVIDSDCPHPKSARRPESDLALLQDIHHRLERELTSLHG